VRARAVHLNVDTIVLRGFSAGQRHRLVAGLRDELARQLAQPGVADAVTRATSASAIAAGGVAIDGTSGEGIGRAAARRITERLRR
jgi:hypothetical protein